MKESIVMRSRISRTFAGAVTAVVALTGAVLLAPAAQATAVDAPLIISTSSGVASGDTSTPLNLTSSGACPVDATNVQGQIFGAGFPAADPTHPLTGQFTSANTPIKSLLVAPNNGFQLPMSQTLLDLGNLQSPPVVFTGTYTIVVTCKKALDPTPLATFTGRIAFAADHQTWKLYVPLGAAPKATKAPAITGVVKVGSTIKVSTGTWSPAAKTTVQWLKDGKAIKGATKAAYKIVKTDKGHKLSVKVTATATGLATGYATTKAVKVTK